MGATRPSQPSPPSSYIPSGTPASDSGTAGTAPCSPYAQPDLRPAAACRRIAVDRMCAGGRSWPVVRTAAESRRVDGPRLPEGAIWESSAIGITSVGRAAGWEGLRARSLPRTSLC